ncbi:MAG TPA: Ig-like domain-containing protein [Mycobacteriales bacterium]|nr:Ig-like domain-containing protein [Mycobacteriales bacterium]
MRRDVRAALVVGLGLAVVGGIGTAGARTLLEERPAPAVAAAAPVPRLVAASADAGVQAWTAPLRVEVADGALTGVVALGPGDEPLAGRLAGGTWTSTGSLVPSATYRLTGTVRDAAGAELQRPLVVRTSDPEQVVTAALRPGDDAVVGVGQPVVVVLDAPVREPAARAAVVERLRVTSTPSVRGGWRWTSPTELHWRPAELWPAGTRVDVRAELEGLALPGGAWGSGVRTSRFTVGDAVVSTVDVAAHTMTVTRNGEVLRVLKASMGKPEHPTRGGTHLVLEKDATRVMDSDTVGLPGAYRTEVQWAVRLTYSGTFTHSAPWSVADQGVRNVSHGCINLSPEDAKWFYDLARRGDVVHVVGTDEPPLPDDPGSVDWNVPFEEWVSG